MLLCKGVPASVVMLTLPFVGKVYVVMTPGRCCCVFPPGVCCWHSYENIKKSQYKTDSSAFDDWCRRNQVGSQLLQQRGDIPAITSSRPHVPALALTCGPQCHWQPLQGILMRMEPTPARPSGYALPLFMHAA